MKPEMITQLAKEAGLVQGPWANGNKERIWQENRDFPDALEVFAGLIVKECIKCCVQVEDDEYEGLDGVSGIRDGALLCRMKIGEIFTDTPNQNHRGGS